MGHPTLTISSTNVNNNDQGNLLSYNITFTWDKVVSNFIESDIITVNGSLSNFYVVSSDIYTVVFKPLINGVCSLTVPEGAAKNSDDEYNQNEYTFTINQIGLKEEEVKKKRKGSFVNPTKEVTTFLESLPASDKTNTTLESLILRYQNDRDALMEIEKAFGVSIVG
jgi:hypothetical protein